MSEIGQPRRRPYIFLIMPPASTDPLFVGGELDATVCQRAVHARDPRFDGVFFVGITTTRIYCRPVCPARVTYADRRRFFKSAAAAERAGYRPCLRCRPELAPGRAICDAVSRLAHAAANRIAAGGLNGRSVTALARELCVSERHLRRALERELGASPLELAQTHRLLLAKRLLVDTDLPVTRVAFASGFQSVRRFNSTFREQYRLSPTQVRRSGRTARRSAIQSDCDLVRLTLGYRPPLDWRRLLLHLRRDAVAGVEVFDGARYGRTIEINGARGVLFVENEAPNGKRDLAVNVKLSASLLPELMPLLARVRQLLDLDAEPRVVERHLRQGGLEELVSKYPGLRLPGAIDGFEIALRAIAGDAIGGVVATTGDFFETGFDPLHRLMPSTQQIADAEVDKLAACGLMSSRARMIVAVARAVLDGKLQLEPGAPVEKTSELLVELGVPPREVTVIVMRALHWPDAFAGPQHLTDRAVAWRPWRAYASLYLEAVQGTAATCRIGMP